MGSHGFSWVLMNFDGFWWILMNFDGFSWVLMGFDEFWWILMGSHGFSWVLMDFDGFWWILMDFYLMRISSTFIYSKKVWFKPKCAVICMYIQYDSAALNLTVSTSWFWSYFWQNSVFNENYWHEGLSFLPETSNLNVRIDTGIKIRFPGMALGGRGSRCVILITRIILVIEQMHSLAVGVVATAATVLHPQPHRALEKSSFSIKKKSTKVWKNQFS